MTAPEKKLENIVAQLSPYEEWQKTEGIPLIRGHSVDDMKTTELGPWARNGGRGAFVNLEGTELSADAYICEIPPGASLNPERHMFEELIFVLQGRGATTIWTKDDRKQTFEWGEGSLFSPPLNVWHQIFNGQGNKPVRYIAITNAPLLINLFHNMDFIFNCDYGFRDRYSGEDGYFSGKGKNYAERIWESNFIANVYDFKLQEWKQRGPGANAMFEMANNTTAAHVSEFPVGSYKKAHRHASTAHLIILSGQGYSLLWPDYGEWERVDWHKDSMFNNGHDRWFHQHFNTGKEPARYLALHWSSRKFGTLSFSCSRRPLGWISIKEGGAQIEYEDEDPRIRELFAKELSKVGLKPQMPGVKK